MSHETIEPGRVAFYHVAHGFSDVLRSREFTEFFRGYGGPAFCVRTRDGWSWSSSSVRAAQFTATFASREALETIVSDAKEATLSRLFLDGQLDLDGNLFVLLSVAEYTLSHSDGMSHGLIQTIARLSHNFSRRLGALPKADFQTSWRCAPDLLSLPVNFFRPWLGEFLGHTCGCFARPGEDLDTAQRNSFERACGWLEIEPGDRLLDVGCGWGSMLIHAAERHGAQAFGIASTDLQADAATERIYRNRLQSRCSVERRSLRSIRGSAGQFDKITDVGIFEQRPACEFSEYLSSVHTLLEPGGLLLLHRLTRSAQAGNFIRSLHPDSLSDSLGKELQMAEGVGFQLVRTENLRKEYQETLRIWIDHLRSFRLSDAARSSARGYRAWMLYLVEIATCLQAGEVQVHRVLLRRSAAPHRKPQSAARAA